MITLDLLPPERRRKKEAKSGTSLQWLGKYSVSFVSKIPFRLLYLYVGGACLALYTFVFFGGLVSGATLRGLRREWEKIAPERERVNRVSKEYQELEVAEKALEKLENPFQWSRKLQELSDSMVHGVWLQELSVGRRRKELPVGSEAGAESSLEERLLILTGSAASPKGDHTAIVARFIRSLKENEGFFADFTEVELESIKRRTIHELEVMDFKIICTFREGILD